jgi:fucose permease
LANAITTRNSATAPASTSALAPVFFYFFVAGIATVMLGPLLPCLIHQWSIPDAQAGTLFAASAAGQFSGSWFAARNLRSSMLYGALFSAAGCFGMAYAGFNLAHLALFLVGLGIGSGLTAGNIFVGTFSSTSRGRLLAWLNVAWGAGAISCPLLVKVVAHEHAFRFLLVAATLLALAALFNTTLPHARSATLRHIPTPSHLPLPLPQLLLFLSAMLIYIGTENALDGWLPTYATRMYPATHASTVSLCFWIAELTGRAIIASVMIFFSEMILFRLCLALLIGAQAVLCFSPHLSHGGIFAITLLAGMTLAPLYPMLLSFLLLRTGNHPRLGQLFAVSAIGVALLPALTGIISTWMRTLRAGLIVPAVGSIVLLALSRALNPGKASLQRTTADRSAIPLGSLPNSIIAALEIDTAPYFQTLDSHQSS